MIPFRSTPLKPAICFLLLSLSFCRTSGSGIPPSAPAFEPFRDTVSFFTPSPVPNRTRINLIKYSIAGLYPASMTWLYTQWYQDYPQSSFHFFNDFGEWEQMDKYAHLWDAYSIGKPLMRLFQWSGMSNKKSAIYGTGIAYLYQTTVEVF